MECNKIQEKLSEYIDGILTPDEKVFVEEHLKSCQRCRESLADLRKTIEHVKNLEEIEPPAWLTQKVMTRVRAEAESKKGILHKLFYPLHIKVPIGAVATIAITTIYIFRAIQPEMRLAKTPSEEIISQIPSVPAKPAEQLMPAKEPEAISKYAEVPKASGPVGEQKEAMSSAGAVAKEEMKREPMPSAPRAEALVKRKIEGTQANEELEKKAIEAANDWLKLVDNNHYEESWETASTLFKAAVSKEQWKQSLLAVRKPLGRLLKREIKSKQYTTSLPGAPDGEYVVIQYATSYENKKSTIETVTPMLDKDGKWKVYGYYIK